MTFNVQLMPAVVTSQGAEAEARAANVVKAIRSLPADEQPDIIAFNEVFNEDGREVLRAGLLPGWPHVAYKLDNCFLKQDSGLLLFSRLPFVDLPSQMYPFPGIVKDAKVAFFSFTESAGWDSAACKGVGIVQVLTGFGLITLAFTHLQAAYEGVEDLHRDVRQNQMTAIETVLDLLGPPGGGAGRPTTILMGDLNIRGDPKADSDEWSATFAIGSSAWATEFVDGWRAYMHPPGASIELDPGYTNNDLETALLSRLDYQVFTTGIRELVPQHMFTRLRNLSDHWALESVVHIRTPNCTPSDAIQLGSVVPSSHGFRYVAVDLQYEGSYQWIFVAEPGTYSLYWERDVAIVVYNADNLTDPVNPFDGSDLRLMDNPDRLQEAAQHGFGPRGALFAPTGPFFILVRSNRFASAKFFVGAATVVVLRHSGASAGEAIALLPWQTPVNPELPSGKPLGNEDLCWFRAKIDRAYAGGPHSSHFLLNNMSGKAAGFELQDANFQILDSAHGSGLLDLELTEPGPEDVYLVLRRTDQQQTSFLVSWKSGLTYLRDDKNVRPIGLRAIDETGWDWTGSDEIRMKLFADDQTSPFHETYWDDADTDEFWSLSGDVEEIAFVHYVGVEVDEEGDFTASSPGAGTVTALTDGVTRSRMIGIDVQSGTYRFECTLSRKPPAS
jgi:hypothetical protein